MGTTHKTSKHELKLLFEECICVPKRKNSNCCAVGGYLKGSNEKIVGGWETKSGLRLHNGVPFVVEILTVHDSPGIPGHSFSL